MDEDIRNRFKASGHSPRPIQYGRPARKTAQAIPASSSTPPQSSQYVQQSTQPNNTQQYSKPVVKRKKKQKQRQRTKATFVIIALLLIISGIGSGAYFQRDRILHTLRPQATTSATTVSASTDDEQVLAEAVETGTIRLSAIGDILTFNTVNSAAKLPSGAYDYAPLLSDIKPFFDKSDIRFCTQSVPTGGTSLGITGHPTFNAPSELALSLISTGCNVINTGSNHTNDKGQPGIDATAKLYAEQKESILAMAGANQSQTEHDSIRYFTVKDTLFAFLSYITKNNNTQVSPYGVSMYDTALAKKQITEAREKANFIIVGIQWGEENNESITPEQERIANELAQANVDIIFGNGPHVLQTAKVLDGVEKHQTLVWFSLGNSLNSQLPINNLTSCMAVLDIELPSLAIVNPSCLPLYMHYEWSPEQKRRGAESDLLARSNLKLLPLDTAADIIAKSQNNTTVETQTDRIKSIVTQYIPIKILTSTTF